MPRRREPMRIGVQPMDWRDYYGGLLEDMPEIAGMAGGITGALDGQSPYGWIDPKMQESIGRQMEPMSTAEYAEARRGVTQPFQEALGQLSSGTAQRGFHSPETVSQAGMGRPMAGLARGLGGLQAKRAEMQRKGAAEAGRQLGGLYQYPAGEYRAGREALGTWAGRMIRMRGLGGGMQTRRRPGHTYSPYTSGYGGGGY